MDIDRWWSGKFDISNEGIVTFKVAPDFETPTDAGGETAADNNYAINVVATETPTEEMLLSLLNPFWSV